MPHKMALKTDLRLHPLAVILGKFRVQTRVGELVCVLSYYVNVG
jgi:hypothetical protein